MLKHILPILLSLSLLCSLPVVSAALDSSAAAAGSGTPPGSAVLPVLKGYSTGTPVRPAARPPIVKDELLLKADRLTYEQAEDVITATGGVEIDWNGSKLYSDIATFYREKDLVTAAGRVKVIKEGDVLAGDSAEFNTENRTALVNNGNIFVRKNNIYLRGETIKKTGDQDYELKKSTITSCNGDDPSWKFRVSDLNVTLDDYAYGKNAIFYLKDVPVFWLPYLVLPVKSERQSGFLPPHFGTSSAKGFFIDLPYYWAVSPNREIIITPDLQVKRGVGLGLEHRYLGDNKGFSDSKGYLIYDTQQERYRGDLEIKQQVNFSADTYWRADVSQITDRSYFTDYGVMSGEYNRQYVGSTAFLSHRREEVLFTGGVDYQSDLDASSNAATLQKLPYVTMASTGTNLPGSSNYYTFGGAVTNFYRDEGWRGQRVELLPQLSIPFASGELFSGRIQSGYSQRFYSAENTTGDGGGTSSLGLLKLNGLVQTELSRVYDTSWGDISRIRHVFTPQLNYSLVQHRGQSDLPDFDYDDRILGGQIISLSLLNLVTGKSGKDGEVKYRDLASFSVTQGYQLSGERRDLLVLVDDGRSFTDTRFAAEISPYEKWRLFTDTRVSPYDLRITNAAAGAEVSSHSGSAMQLNYNYADGQLDYLSGLVTVTELKPFTLAFSGRYALDRPGFLEKIYSLVFTQQCWSMLFSYQERTAEKVFNISFTLLGLGAYKIL